MKLKELLLQALCGLLLLALFESVEFDIIKTIIKYVFVSILIILFLRLYYSIYRFLEYNKESRFSKNGIRSSYKWYERMFAFIIGYVMWLFLKSK
jgi:hypothetical protein